jgi:AAA family ATP:ADP antiporter
VLQSFRIIRESGLLQTIAILICLSSIVTTAAGWQLKAIAKDSFIQKDAVAAFLATFRGYTGILALVAQLFLTSRILKRFGIGAALFVLPLLLMAGSAALLLTGGSLLAATVLKGSDKVFRYSIDTSALQLLYLPIPAGVKLQAKSFIDTVIWRLGDGLAGFTVLLFATLLHFTPQQIGLPNMGFLVVWIGVAMFARRQYVGTLSSNMEQLQLDPERNTTQILDALTTNVLADKLNSKDPAEVLYALNLFKMGQEHQSHDAVRTLLEHPNPEIRTKAISVLGAAGDKTARALIAPLLKDADIQVRTEALLYLSQYDHIDPLEQIEQGGDFADYSVRSGIVAYLARLGDDENFEGARVILDGMVREEGTQGQRTRLEAARLLGSLPARFEPQLGHLLQDEDKEVVRYAMRAAAIHHRRRWTPLLVERLADPDLHHDAVEAILAFGEAIAGTLRDYLGDESVPIEVRREIPPILLRLGTAVSIRILANNVIQGDNVLRYRIISALNKLLDLHKDVEMDAGSIETVLVAEIMGYYRSCQLLDSAVGDAIELKEQLKESMKQDLERIFRLMKLLSPEQALQNAYIGLQSKDPVTHANALEYLDNTLKPQLRNLLVPLIDSDVSDAERARLADRFLGMKTTGDPAAPYSGRHRG